MKKFNLIANGYSSPSARVFLLRTRDGFLVNTSISQVEPVTDNPNQEEEW